METPTQVRDAALARAEGMRARADRPKQRRAAEAGGWGVTSAVRAAIREMPTLDSLDAGAGIPFFGCASATGRGYDMFDAFGPYTEQVNQGAFEQTLAQPGLDVPLVLNHDSMRRIARTTNGSLTLTEDDNGLSVDAPSLDPNDADVAYILPKMRSGLIDEMSFRFVITSGEWSPDFTEYHITGVDINRGDVSIVGYGANPFTTASVRDAIAKINRGRFLDTEDVTALADVLATLATVDADRLREALERADAPRAVQRMEELTAAWRAEHMTLTELLAI